MLPVYSALLLVALAGNAFSERSAPTNVHCDNPKHIIYDHVPYARTKCNWLQQGDRPASFKIQAFMPSGDIIVQEDIANTTTSIDLDYFVDYKIVISAVYMETNGTKTDVDSKPLKFSSGECAPPEIVWYHFSANRTTVDLKWLPTTSLYEDYTTGHNLTLVPNRNGLKTLNFITPKEFNYHATGLTPKTTYRAHLYPFYITKTQQVLRAPEIVFKFTTMR